MKHRKKLTATAAAALLAGALTVSAAAAGPPTGAPHFPQKADPSATSFPHFGQNITTYLSSLFPSK